VIERAAQAVEAVEAAEVIERGNICCFSEISDIVISRRRIIRRRNPL